MKIFGHEYGFMFTVQASIDLAAICPEKKIENLDKLFAEDDAAASMVAAAKMAEILSRAHEQNKKFMDPEYEPCILTAPMALALPHKQFSLLQKEVMESVQAGKETEVELEPSKKNNAQGAEVTE